MATIGFSGLGNSFKSALVANRGHRFSAVVSQKVAFCCGKYDLELHRRYHSHVCQHEGEGGVGGKRKSGGGHQWPE
jgi:hypothetical protein